MYATGGNGRGRGFCWTRRPMNREELEHVGRAAVVALEVIMSELEQEVYTLPDPVEVIAASTSDREAQAVGDRWVEESIKEAARRREIVERAMRRRHGLAE